MELSEQQSLRGDSVDHWSPDVTAVAAKVGVAKVIGDNEENVRPVICLRKYVQRAESKQQEKYNPVRMHYRMYKKEC